MSAKLAYLNIIAIASMLCDFTHSLDIDFSEFYTECVCLKSIGDPLREVSSTSEKSCLVACMGTQHCNAFSYCVNKSSVLMQGDLIRKRELLVIISG